MTKLTTLTTLCLVASPALAQTAANGFDFTRVVGTGDAVPGAPAGTTFGYIATDTGNVDQGWLSFDARLNGGPDAEGLFTVRTDGSNLTFIAGESTTMVNGRQIGFFEGTMVSGGRTFFRGDGAEGIYHAPVTGGPLTAVVDQTTAIPDATGDFTTLSGQFSHSGSDTLFTGTGGGAQLGVYLDRNGSLSKIADRATPSLVNPGGATFSRFAHPFIGNGALSFSARDTDGTDFLAVDFGSGLTAAVVEGASVNGGLGGTLTSSIFQSTVSGDLVAFQGSTTASSNSLYLYDNTTGQITTIADAGTTVPGTGGAPFFFSFNLSINEQVVMFEGQAGGGVGNGVYLYDLDTKTISRLLAKGDTLFGKTVNDVDFRPAHGLSGYPEVALRVEFTDFTYAMVTTAIPEPGSLALLTLGGLCLLRRRRC